LDFIHKVRLSTVPDILQQVKGFRQAAPFFDLADLACRSLVCSPDKLQIGGTVPYILLGANNPVRTSPKEDQNP